MKNKHLEIIEEHSYWIEAVNHVIYDAMVSYMHENNLNKTEFAQYLGISKGRLSQILNSGEVNFSLQKLFYICLKINKLPSLILEDKATYIAKVQTYNPYKNKSATTS